MDKKIVIYTDGGARGNPGPAALGVAIFFPKGKENLFGEKEKSRNYGEYLGVKTNNEAEYLAIIFALKKVRQLAGKEDGQNASVEIRTDSELVASQLNGLYKVKEPTLKELFLEVWNLKQDFEEVKFVVIPREENKLADRLVNRALDAAGN